MMLLERPQSGRSHFTPLTTAPFLGLVRRLPLNPLLSQICQDAIFGDFRVDEKAANLRKIGVTEKRHR
jgi:hypothetical protein